ncbi:ATP-dependent helicase/nuclease subunit A [Poriferisphaera corsica]|uniref:DNA 3'-5' helicase n=1 Tax=Poriferisphaera corsica TaxID=2528020 RepID=A0A517YQF1_9BACT|nr:UvrD-helicase domain-containing protein [Poriferisphaera corsica]QDU32441.1 ATP-dependent helicase/nuclease subunit A [Poriferisphaera corsica]
MMNDEQYFMFSDDTNRELDDACVSAQNAANQGAGLKEGSDGQGGENPHRVIRASAGAGKTYQLTTRYLLLLRAGQDPDEILATTFTRKAAGEILGRVLGRLAKALVDEGERELLSKQLVEGAFYEEMKEPMDRGECLLLLKRLVGRIHRLSISTLDSFFQRIASSFRLEIGFPGDAIMTDERSAIATRLRWDAIEAMLSKATGSEDDLRTLLRLLKELYHDSVRQTVTGAIDEIVMGLYELYREVPEGTKWSRIEAVGKLDETGLQAAVERLVGMEDELAQTKAGKVNANWLKAWRNEVACAQAGDWGGFVEKGIAKAVLNGDEKFSRAEICEVVRDAYWVLISHARGVMLERHGKQTTSTWRMLRDFDVCYRRLCGQRSVVMFSDVTHELAGYLGEQESGVMEEIYFRLDGQVKHVLLDEFQDTSRAQWSVLEPMAEEVSAHVDGWWERSLFCVGDTKQAIYGWRGGCAGLFDEVESLPGIDEGKSLLRLDESRRSSQVVLDAVNRVYEGIGGSDVMGGKPTDYPERVMAAATMGEMFGEHRAYHRDLGGHAVLESSPAAVAREDEDDGDMVDEVVGHEVYVAGRVRDLAGRYAGKEIGVLVSRNATVNRVLFELKKMGVAASGEGGGVITDEPAVGAVLNALSMADHPGDKAAVYGVVNGPMSEVLGLKGRGREQVEGVSKRVRGMLLRDGYAKVIGDWARSLSGWCDGVAVKRLGQLVDVAERYEREGMGGSGGEGLLRPSQFVKYAEMTRLSEMSDAKVRVMTVHQSKGLEFDIVVLGELDQAIRCQWLAVAERDDDGEVVAVYRSGDEVIRAMYEPLRRAYETRCAEQWVEELCKLYVAMTRAKHGLYMIVKGAGMTKKGALRSRGGSYAALLVDQLCEVEEEGSGGQVLFEMGDADWDLQMKRRTDGDGVEDVVDEERGWDLPGSIGRLDAGEVLEVLGEVYGEKDDEGERMWTAVSPSSMEGQGTVLAEDILQVEKKEHGGRLFGTLVHEWFSLYGFWGEEPRVGEMGGRGGVERYWLTGEMDATDGMLLQVGGNAVEGLTDDEILEKADPFRAMLRREGVQRALRRREDGAMDLLWRERGFAVRVADGRLMRGAFDRVVVHRCQVGDEVRVVGATLIDFKTDRYEGEEGLRDKVAVYRPQVEAYRLALSRLLWLSEREIDVKLLFVGTGEVVTVD